MVDDWGGLAELLPRWDGLLANGPDASIYLSRGWVEPWMRHFVLGGGPVAGLARPHVVVLRRGPEIAAVLPWIEVPLPGWGRMLVGIGQETADYGGLLLGADPDTVLPTVLDHFETELADKRTIINFTRLHPDSLLLRALRQRFEAAGNYALSHSESTPYPFIDIASQPDPEAWLKKTLRRNDVLRRERRLSEQHELTFTFHRPGHSGADLGTFLDLHQMRWNHQPKPAVGLFATAKGQAFAVDAAAALDEAGTLRISILRADGKPIAARFGSFFGGIYQGMKSGWDPSYSSFGPGHLIVGRVLRELVAQGVAEMDMLRGAGVHKSEWSTGERVISYWTLGRADRWSTMDQRALMTVLRLRSHLR